MQRLRAFRSYHVLAIESSCDDAAVCLINRHPGRSPVLIEHLSHTLDSVQAGGIVPAEAKTHHQQHLAPQVQTLLRKHGITRPDLVCGTRGPGMMGSLSAGLNLAKGLAVAWDVPLVGVHHMLAHLLMPRFAQLQPQFPYVSLLVSGGHTMVVLSHSVLKHTVLANTIDIAVGDMLDKCGRELGLRGKMIGREMEAFVNSGRPDNNNNQPHNVPATLQFPAPLQNQKGRVDLAAFSFAGFISALRTAQTRHFGGTPLAELAEVTRQELATRIQAAVLGHVVEKTRLALVQARQAGLGSLPLVVSGGVASNQTLRKMLETLPMAGLHFPKPRWCTDNALMIGWAGIELWEQGLHSDLGVLPVARWPLDQLQELWA